MSVDIILVIVILIVSVILFSWDRLGPDLVAMMVLIVLAVTELVTVEQAFSGFANTAVVTVWAIYIISEGLFITGVADYLGTRILSVAGTSEQRLLLVVMLLAGIMSAFMNNVGATALLMPAIVNMSKRAGVSASKLLMPLAFASLMGGNLTLIGTPPNILAAEILQDYQGFPPFGFFDFMPMGIVILVTGMIYMALIGRHLLPDTHHQDDLTQSYNLRDYTTELFVPENSPLVGKTLSDSRLGSDYDITIIRKISAGTPPLSPDLEELQRWIIEPNDIIQAHDVFLVQGKLEDVLQLRESKAMRIKSDVRLTDDKLQNRNQAIAEAVIPPKCELIDKTLEELQFRDKFKLNVLAIWRDETPLQQRLANVTLQLGDVLLIQGQKDNVAETRLDPGLIVTGLTPYESKRERKAPIAIALILFMIIAATMGMMNIAVAAVIAAMGMVLFNVLSMDEAYRSIDWRTIFLIAGMLPLGIAMENTGTATFLAEQIIIIMGGFGPVGVLVGIYIITLLITQAMSNAAATVLFVPIAIDTAYSLAVDPRPFVMSVVIAASTAFLTPIGHQSNLLVYGVGGYKFTDFTKVGLGLNLMYVVIIAVVLPLVWPL